jgi:hypothetical protein
VVFRLRLQRDGRIGWCVEVDEACGPNLLLNAILPLGASQDSGSMDKNDTLDSLILNNTVFWTL